jgi:peptidoglycan/LPS O-acetylase OafA/YrhL
VGIASAVIIVASLETNWAGNRVLRLRPITAVGLVAYGLYLWHYPINQAVLRYGVHWTTSARLAVAAALTTLLTVASWIFVEKPFLRRKVRLAR